MSLYPISKPYKAEMLSVSDLHSISIRQYGNPLGKAMLFIHGGPGGGASDSDAQYFDPKVFRIILVDQRGCGLSTPASSLVENTTQHLIADFEKIRIHLQISSYHVFGGSWGSTLALAYAQAHPNVVLSLTLRGIFLLRRSELEFFYQSGASHLFPEYFDEYMSPIPVEERGDLITAYYKRLTGTDEAEREKCGMSWSTWEMATSRLIVDPEYIAKAKAPGFADAFARIESHYFVNGGFMKDGELLEKKNIDKIRRIPTTIIQGRYDVVCPMKSAYELKKEFKEAKLIIIKDAGHSAIEKGTTAALLEAVNALR